ncbi:MAG: DUF4959 domain-containing protein, partial [Cyclobacteriaceae bacterium]
MKNIRLIIALLAVGSLLVVSCNEDSVTGPFYNDGVAPSPVTNVTVANRPGGAVVTYKLPLDQDLLYVEASYTLADGREITARSSAFKNSIVIEGLRDQAEFEIEVFAVDKGLNKSIGVKATVSPETAPIDLFFESLSMRPTFGGVLLEFENPLDTKLEIQLYQQDTVGGKLYDVYKQSGFVESSLIDTYVFRGFEATEAGFKVVAVDRWNNITDTLSGVFTPLLEIMLDESKFGVNVLETDGTVLEFGDGNYFVDQLWDGQLAWPDVFHTNDVAQDPIPAIPPYTEPGLVAFTIDLGQIANISRIKFFPRSGEEFSRGSIRQFEVWGVEEIPTDGGASFNGWSKLVTNGEIIPPSGLV